jgi:hypothetical protein
MTYQVIRTEQTEQGDVFVMNNGESVLICASGYVSCRNAAGRGFARTGRFAHIAQAMLLAVARFQKAAA